jgi:hypothetical protein
MVSMDGKQERIDQLKNGMRVISMNSAGVLEEDEVTNIHSTLIESVLTI